MILDTSEAGNAPAPESVGVLKDVQIFKVGTWRGSRTVEATPKMLAEMVDNFHSINQIDGYGVPVKIGHSSGIGAPAFGWMTALRSDGTTLTADFADVPSTIIDAVGKRRYNSVSVEIYPMVDHGGKTFTNVLSGVALLGAEWPAVKGLKPLSAASKFSEIGVLELNMKEPEVANENTAVTFTQAQSDAFVFAAEARVRSEMSAALAAETAKVTAAEALTLTEKARADKAEAEITKLKDASDQAAIDAVIETAEKSGKITPAKKASIAKLAGQVMKATAGADRAELMTTFTELVGSTPVKVKFGEQGAADPKDDAAQGQKVADQVDTAVKAAMSANPKLNYEAALKVVFAADPALKTAYAQEM